MQLVSKGPQSDHNHIAKELLEEMLSEVDFEVGV